MSDYQAVYEDLFVKNLRKYSSIKKPAKTKIDRLLDNTIVFLTIGPHDKAYAVK